MTEDDDGAGAVGGRSVPLFASVSERLRRCDFGGRRLPLLVFVMLVTGFRSAMVTRLQGPCMDVPPHGLTQREVAIHSAAAPGPLMMIT